MLTLCITAYQLKSRYAEIILTGSNCCVTKLALMLFTTVFSGTLHFMFSIWNDDDY